MNLLLMALVGLGLCTIVPGHSLPVVSQSSFNSSASQRASVSAGPCSKSPGMVTIPNGDYADFTSPNYPNNYNAFQKCSWKFTTDANSILSLSCDPVVMSWFSKLYVIDQETESEQSCLLCFESTYKHTFKSNSATVGLQNDFWFTNKGFACRISSVTKPCYCGVVNSKRIVGGVETAPNEYPWMVLLVRPGDNSNFCGGSLITDQFVLTAAHCTSGQSASDIQVRLGVHYKLTTNPSGSLRRNVLEIINHPSYDAWTNDYDASLLRISAVDFAANPTIRPICLPTTSDAFVGRDAVAAGWGTTTVGGSTSASLMEVTVPVISNLQCNVLLYGKITSSMLCAGIVGRDSCQGDSGGPLFLSEGTTSHKVIIGIVSWGYGCGDLNKPGVYARVTVFQSWIESQVANSLVCSAP